MPSWLGLLLILLYAASALAAPIRVEDLSKPTPKPRRERYHPDKRAGYGESYKYSVELTVHGPSRRYDAAITIWWDQKQCEVYAVGIDQRIGTVYSEDCHVEPLSPGADKAHPGSVFALHIGSPSFPAALCSGRFVVRPQGKLELLETDCHMEAADLAVPGRRPSWVPTPGGGP